MKRGWLIAIIVLGGLGTWFIFSLATAFDPAYDNAEIKQNIGGTLICHSIYNADIHSWEYDISYQYKLNNDSIIDIGSGIYFEREWKKDEQLIQYKNWTILKTGAWGRNDKIIIGDLKTKKWTEYDLTPENIEKDSLWKSLKIPSLINYCCSEVFVDRIHNGQFNLHYKFRTSETFVDKYDERKIYYEIDGITGRLKLTKIEKPNNNGS